MKLWSESWVDGERIPAPLRCRQARRRRRRRLLRQRQPASGLERVPAGTRSLALICHDFDVPSRGDDVNQPDREVPADLPRVDFFHWVLVDLPPARARSPRARSAAASRPAASPARQVRAGFRGRAPRPQRLHRLVRRQPRDGRRLFRLRRPVPAVQRLARSTTTSSRSTRCASSARRSRARSPATTLRRAIDATSWPRRPTPAPTR